MKNLILPISQIPNQTVAAVEPKQNKTISTKNVFYLLVITLWSTGRFYYNNNDIVMTTINTLQIY